MLNTRLRKQLEWAFYNYIANKELGADGEDSIAESGLVAAYRGCGGCGQVSDPTYKKALNVAKYRKPYLWAKVVENTYTTYESEAEYEIMVKRYVKKMSVDDLIKEGINERLFYRWRERWLGTALYWALKYELVRQPSYIDFF